MRRPTHEIPPLLNHVSHLTYEGFARNTPIDGVYPSRRLYSIVGYEFFTDFDSANAVQLGVEMKGQGRTYGPGHQHNVLLLRTAGR
jgi:hypothetical protein